jgi:magnesium-transporting ATPase (P-type)
VTSGRCRAVVIGTGTSTAIGKIRDAMVASQVGLHQAAAARYRAATAWCVPVLCIALHSTVTLLKLARLVLALPLLTLGWYPVSCGSD